MQSVQDLRASIESGYADILEEPYPRFSNREMARRDAALTDMIAAHQLDVLIVAEFMRAGTATGWITGWPVTAEALARARFMECPLLSRTL